jgi:hypothetical protein
MGGMSEEEVRLRNLLMAFGLDPSVRPSEAELVQRFRLGLAERIQALGDEVKAAKKSGDSARIHRSTEALVGAGGHFDLFLALGRTVESGLSTKTKARADSMPPSIFSRHLAVAGISSRSTWISTTSQTGAAAGDVDDHGREFTAGQVGDPFLHERDARTGGGSHSPGSSRRSPQKHVDGGHLTLRLD